MRVGCCARLHELFGASSDLCSVLEELGYSMMRLEDDRIISAFNT